MGTRHLIAVQQDGEYKVAQYGQWDGYPEGQGLNILYLLKLEGFIDALRATLSRVRFVEPEGRDKDFWDSYNAAAPEWSNEPDNRTDEQKRWFYTYIHRNLGAEILTNIVNSDDTEILLNNQIEFSGDSLFCEYGYVIDLDANTFEVYRGFNKEPLAHDARFKDFKTPENRVDKEYFPINLIVCYTLDALPTEEEFLADCEEDDDDVD